MSYSRHVFTNSKNLDISCFLENWWKHQTNLLQKWKNRQLLVNIIKLRLTINLNRNLVRIHCVEGTKRVNKLLMSNCQQQSNLSITKLFTEQDLECSGAQYIDYTVRPKLHLSFKCESSHLTGRWMLKLAGNIELFLLLLFLHCDWVLHFRAPSRYKGALTQKR